MSDDDVESTPDAEAAGFCAGVPTTGLEREDDHAIGSALREQRSAHPVL
jgi:hypothetical protein